MISQPTRERRAAAAARTTAHGRRRHRHQHTSLGGSVWVVVGALAVALSAVVVAGAWSLRRGTSAAAAAPLSVAPAAVFGARPLPATEAPPGKAAMGAAAAASEVSASSPATTAPAAAPSPAAQQAESAPTGSSPVAVAVPVAALAADDAGTRVATALSAPPATLEREHKVAAGETLSAIAQRYGLTNDTLVINNAGVTDRDMLKVGQTLRIPPKDGLLYEVRLGESVGVIARRFGVEASDILSEPANHLSSPDMVREGQLLLIPGAKVAPPPPPVIVPTIMPRVVSTATVTTPTATTTSRAAAPATVAATQTTKPLAGGGWIWPISGPLSSFFGPSHPLGIDVDLYGREGAPIGAARAGVVTFAGGNPCCSYGYYVEVDHGDGFRTVYAHFNAPPVVRIGQSVSQGQVLGYAGSTGYSTGVHLHFEIRKGGVPVNPLAYLP